jgi:hypothetical protein
MKGSLITGVIIPVTRWSAKAADSNVLEHTVKGKVIRGPVQFWTPHLPALYFLPPWKPGETRGLTGERDSSGLKRLIKLKEGSLEPRSGSKRTPYWFDHFDLFVLELYITSWITCFTVGSRQVCVVQFLVRPRQRKKCVRKSELWTL